jgi:hypothetical protein
MLLLHKPIASLSHQDVMEFLSLRLPEGTQLDYKEDVPAQPSKLAQTLAAFANTLGGVLLIGVKEGTDKHPIVPSPGIPLRRGLVEQIQRVAVDHLSPLLVPEVGVVRIPGSDERCFLIVRVPQSLQAPHAIANGREIYVRRGDSSQPESLAELRWIEHLLERRAVPEQRRRSLLQRSLTRFEAVHGYAERRHSPCWAYAYSCPSFPTGALGTEQELYDSLQRRLSEVLVTSEGHRRSEYLQRSAGGVTRGVPFFTARDPWIDASTEGHLMMAELLEELDFKHGGRNGNEADFGILAWDVLKLVTRTLDWCHQLLSGWNWQGHVTLGLVLKRVRGSRLTWHENERSRWDDLHEPPDDPDSQHIRVIDAEVSLEETVLSSEFEKPEALIARLLQRLSWCMGMPPLDSASALQASSKVLAEVRKERLRSTR